MKVEVDSTLCQGHARCYEICPDVFDLDDAGFAVVRTPDVPPGLESDGLGAAGNCPEGAISTR
jgi:ferredoxin